MNNENQKLPIRFNKKIILAVVVVLLAMTGGSYYYMNSRSIVPSKIRAESSIPILYPTKLPDGYKLIDSSFNFTAGNLVSYYAENSSGKRIIFTVQERPKNFNYDKFYSESLTNSTKFTTPLGEAAIGTASDQILGSLATDKSWIIITTNSKVIGSPEFRAILASIKEAS